LKKEEEQRELQAQRAAHLNQIFLGIQSSQQQPAPAPTSNYRAPAPNPQPIPVGQHFSNQQYRTTTVKRESIVHHDSSSPSNSSTHSNIYQPQHSYSSTSNVKIPSPGKPIHECMEVDTESYAQCSSVIERPVDRQHSSSNSDIKDVVDLLETLPKHN
jgi:hypothetical protein